MSATHTLRVSSRDIISSLHSNTKFSADGLQTFCRHVRLKQVVLPNLFNNIRKLPFNDRNSTLSYETGGTPAAFTVPDGFYSVSDLITYIQTQLTALSITLVLDNNTGLITLTNGGAATFTVLSQTTNSMANVLGIATDTVVAAAGTLTFTNKPNLYSYQMVFIKSSKLCNGFNMLSLSQRLATVASIPVNVPYGGLITYEPAEAHSMSSNVLRNIESCDIELTNHFGETLSLPSNHHMDLIFEMDIGHSHKI